MPHESKNWHLPAWAKERGKLQADLVRDLDLTKNSAHKLWYGKQAVSQEQLQRLAAWAEIEVYELFMSPARAKALHQLRETARVILEGSTDL